VRRKTWVLAAATVGAALIFGAGILVAGSGAKPTAPSTPQPATATAEVKGGELSATVALPGTLTYQAQADGAPYSVINQAQGTYTELPQPGQVVTRGQVLYRVDGSPVVLLYGPTPAYRTLAAGASGANVAQLNANLVALGYATPSQLDPTSPSYGASTAAAVAKLQAALGLNPNGTLTLGQAVFEPSPLRVTALSAPLGGSAQSGQTAMQATSTTRQVQVALDAAQQTDRAVGDKVTITLPDDRTTPGTVSSVGSVATCPPAPGPGGTSPSAAGPGTDSCTSGNSATATPTVTVVVTPADPAATGTWDQAPVRVSITTASVADATAVPVTALLAQSGGGYAVEVVEPGGANHLVPVSLGLFDDADGLVQVTGSGLAAGARVVVPAI
jgi:hypothetical protein